MNAGFQAALTVLPSSRGSVTDHLVVLPLDLGLVAVLWGHVVLGGHDGRRGYSMDRVKPRVGLRGQHGPPVRPGSAVLRRTLPYEPGSEATAPDDGVPRRTCRAARRPPCRSLSSPRARPPNRSPWTTLRASTRSWAPMPIRRKARPSASRGEQRLGGAEHLFRRLGGRVEPPGAGEGCGSRRSSA